MKTILDRRNFLKKTTAAGLSLTLAPGIVFSRNASSRQSSVSIGFIGVGGHGHHLIEHALKVKDVTVKAICDIKKENLEQGLNMVKKAPGLRPSGYGEHEYIYREMLEKEDLDGDIIDTPWRWHIPWP